MAISGFSRRFFLSLSTFPMVKYLCGFSVDVPK